MKQLFILLVLGTAFILQAEIKICAHCGKGSRYMRYSAENRHFCSDKCARAKFSCSNCGNIPKGRYMIIMGMNGEHKRFCSRCSKLEKCFSCFFPSGRGKSFSDGRFQCLQCSRTSLDREQMQTLLRQLRNTLSALYGYDARHRITLRLVNRNVLRKIAGSKDVMGCMKTQVTTKETFDGFSKKIKKEWQCVLYILDSLPRIAAAKVMVHELTHDYLYHHAGAGKNPQITEGICEAVSGSWLRQNGHQGYFEAMQKIPTRCTGRDSDLSFRNSNVTDCKACLSVTALTSLLFDFSRRSSGCAERSSALHQ